MLLSSNGDMVDMLTSFTDVAAYGSVKPTREEGHQRL
jgi:hypothetical protein